MSKTWDSALLLLSKGADPNKAASDGDGNVFTPLFVACELKAWDIALQLLNKGANPKGI